MLLAGMLPSASVQLVAFFQRFEDCPLVGPILVKAALFDERHKKTEQLRYSCQEILSVAGALQLSCEEASSHVRHDTNGLVEHLVEDLREPPITDTAETPRATRLDGVPQPEVEACKLLDLFGVSEPAWPTRFSDEQSSRVLGDPGNTSLPRPLTFCPTSASSLSPATS